ncbi:MAG: phosphatase [Eubacteriales bacterium]
MKMVLDTHTHSIVSGHAYNTMKEMIEAARKKGLEGIALTEHAPNMMGTTGLFYFMNSYVVPDVIDGVRVFMGAELNILDETGRVDLPDSVCEKLDLNIASIHMPKGCYEASKGIVLNTQAYVNAMKHSFVNIIGHPDDSRFPVDLDTIVAAAKEHHVLVELNNSSLNPAGYRENAMENQVKIIELCKKYNTSVSLGSDAHIDLDVGNFSRIIPLLEANEFPEELIANTSMERLLAYINVGKN